MYEPLILVFYVADKCHPVTIMKLMHLHPPMGTAAWDSLACSAAWTAIQALLPTLLLANLHKAGLVSYCSAPVIISGSNISAAVFSLNEPDVNSISPSDAASWYQEYINPLVCPRFSTVSEYG